MKRSELLKILIEHGCSFFAEGKRHEQWINSAGEKFPVPRHQGKEISTPTVQAILKQAGIKR